MTAKRSVIVIAAFVLTVVAVYWYSLIQNPMESESNTLSIAEDILQSENQEFAKVTAPRDFIFPQDHGPHLDYRSEWWYFTGNVVATNGERYGYEFTVFRQASDNSDLETLSKWETDQIYMAHLTLTDAGHRKFYSEERFSRGALGLAQATASPFLAQVGDWSASGSLVSDCTGCLELEIQAAGDGFAINLDLKSLKPVVYQGDRGFSQKGDTIGNASHYYSLTRLETVGEISINGTSKTVTGLSWMDHEWSTSALGDKFVGWDWVSLQFDDGRELMYYQLRTKDGTTSETSEGTLVNRDGTSERLMRERVRFNPTRTWTSQLTDVVYPVAWNLEIPDKNLSLKIEPIIDYQEFDNIFRYWEGAVDVSGTDGTSKIAGSGYLELVGY